MPALALMTLLTLLLAAPDAFPAGALPTAGWPETRHDPAQTALSGEPVLLDPELRWIAPLGPMVWGEPAAAECRVVATSSDGQTAAFDARTGAELWRDGPIWALLPTSFRSAVALDPSGRGFVGLPGDPALARIWDESWRLCIGVSSFAVDFGRYPDGPDLSPELVPDFLAAMPFNPIAGREMRYSLVPSPGDYRYEKLAADGYALGVWWIDGKLLSLPDACEPPLASWGVSSVRGGLPSALDLQTGSVIWRDPSIHPSYSVVPHLHPGGALWTTAEDTDLARTFPRLGRLRLTDPLGGPLLERRIGGPIRGGAARDAASGRTFVSRAASSIASFINSTLRSLGTAIESYQVDNGVPPFATDLAPHLAPTFLKPFPHNPIQGREMRYSATPSPGDYVYDFPAPFTSYTLGFWGEDGTLIAEFSDGAMTRQASDLPPAVLAHDAAGNFLWRTDIGTTSNDISPPAYRADGTVLVATRAGEVVALDALAGTPRFLTTLSGDLSAGLALLPDGGIAVASLQGTLSALAPDGTPRWTQPTGARADAPPTATADGAIYQPGSDGILRAYAGGGTLLWQLGLGGAGSAGLTTAVIAAPGWLYLGRSDGQLAGIASRGFRETPGGLGNHLLAFKDQADVCFALRPGAPPACSYNFRRAFTPVAAPSDPLAAHAPPDPPRDVGAVPGGPARVFYHAYLVSCCLGLQGP